MSNSKEHLKSAGKNYSSHFRFAFYYGWLMTIGGLSSMVHAIFPALFPDYADRVARALCMALKSLDDHRAANGLPARGGNQKSLDLLLPEDRDRVTGSQDK